MNKKTIQQTRWHMWLSMDGLLTLVVSGLGTG